jgi:hypothetical protein
MHLDTTESGALASVAIEAALRNGRVPVVVWLPKPARAGKPRCFDVLLCERLPDGAYKVNARLGAACCEQHGFARNSPSWHAHLAGAQVRMFRQRVTPVNGHTRVIMPNGSIVGAV